MRALVVLFLVACGGHPSAPSARWKVPAALAYVPADSPYVLAGLEPLDDSHLQRMFGNFGTQLAQLRDKHADTSKLADRVILAIADEIAGKDYKRWRDDLGFDTSGRFVLYGVGIWPVLRVELADPSRTEAVIARVAGKLGGVHDGSTWRVSGKSLAVVAAIQDRELVVALLPEAKRAELTARVLATPDPARADEQTKRFAAVADRHHMTSAFIGYIETATIVRVFEQGIDLDGMVRIPEACRADAERLAALAPRAVLGYERFDAKGVDGSLVIELAPVVLAGFERLHAKLPPARSTAASPLFSLDVAVDVDAAVALLQTGVSAFVARPFTCAELAKANDGLRDLKTELANNPLPPMFRGMRGASIVVDDITGPPYDGSGYAVVASDHVSDLVAALTSSSPQLASLGLATGKPVAVPVDGLGLGNVKSVHVAVGRDRAVLAVGADSAVRAASELSAGSEPTPMFRMRADVTKLVTRFPELRDKIAQSESFADLADETLTIDVRPDGLALEVQATWK